MSSRATLITVLLAPLLIYGVMLAAYVAWPTLVHFRAWEMFDIFVYHGYHDRSVRMPEAGESTREYLIQRYTATNTVTVDALGHRVACYDSAGHHPRLLALGDSQLFGSGSDDRDTLPAQLCSSLGANVYNGARRYGLELLRVREMPFDTVLFTATEALPMAGTFCKNLGQFAAEIDQPLPLSALAIGQARQPRETLRAANKFLRGFLGSRLKAALQGTLRGLEAPTGHAFKYPHRHHPIEDVVAAEVTCAKALANLLEPRGIKTGFMYFPAHQTLYGAENGLKVDADTLNFVSTVSARLAREGLRTLDSRACLERARRKDDVYLRHDTHLNAAGFAALASCIAESDLAPLAIAR